MTPLRIARGRALTGAAVLAASLAGGPAAARAADFASTGAEQTFTVPSNVSTLSVVVVGAAGAPGGISGAPGGRGGQITASLPVRPGQILYIEVGGAGSVTTAGFNGGGAGGASSGGFTGGGGGGASDVRTVSRTSAATLGSRLLVAAGGGGGGIGGGNGDADANGTAGGTAPGGQAGGEASGGTGGSAAGCSGNIGGQGVFGTGGDGGTGAGYGGAGGGGGGWYGGGGGGGDPTAGCSGSGGGGGGSSHVYGGAINPSVGLAAAISTPPSVTITFTADPQIVGTEGPAGPTGSDGPQGTTGGQGPAGAQGPVGPAGKIRLVTCTTTTKTVKGKKRAVKKCTTKLISGSVSFTAVGNARASLVRHGVIYATGIVARKGLVLRAQRRIPVGRYTLRIHSGNQTTGTPITVT